MSIFGEGDWLPFHTDDQNDLIEILNINNNDQSNILHDYHI